MKTVVAHKQKRLDLFLWVLTIAVVLGGLWANQHYASLEWGLRAAVALVATALMVTLLLMGSTQGRHFSGFLLAVRGELRKVAWPGRKETTNATIMVVIAVVLMALLLWVIDSGLMWVFNLMTGQGGA